MTVKALIVVDVQADFLPGGALGIDGGDEIIEPILKYAKSIHDRGGLVIATRDYHPADHCSFSDDPQFVDKSWPPHCMQGTKGVKIDKRIQAVADYVVSKGYDKDEEAYSGFAGTTLKPKQSLEQILKDHDVDSVYVVGLAFDYCVKHTALDANALGYPTTVWKEMTRSVSPENDQKTAEDLERAGVWT